MPEQTTYQIVQSRKNELNDRWAEIKDTAELLDPRAHPFEMAYDAGHPVNDIINVTTNAAMVFVDAVISQTMAGKWQPIVEGNLPVTRKTYIEGALERLDNLSDAFILDTFGKVGFNTEITKSIFKTGMIGVINITQVKNDDIRHFCEVVDMGATAFTYGQDGWIAPEAMVPAWKLALKYQDVPVVMEAVKKLALDKSVNFMEYWSAKKHEIWFDKNIVLEQKNSSGIAPFVVIDVGQDILWMIRHLIPEYSRLLSVLATLGHLAIKPRMQRQVKPEHWVDGAPTISSPKPGQNQEVPEGEKFEVIPNPDLNRAFLDFKEAMWSQVKDGGLSDSELGDASNPNLTAVRIFAQSAIRAARRRPYYEGLEVLKSKLAQLRINQLRQSIDSGKTVMLGKPGSKMDFSVDKLGDPDEYSISYRLQTKSKEEELANIAEATAAIGAGIPQEVIDRDIHQAENPEEWQRLRAMARAKESDELLSLEEAVFAFIDEADNTADEDRANLLYDQARDLSDTCAKILRERKQGPVGGAEGVTKPATPKPNTGNLLPRMVSTGVS